MRKMSFDKKYPLLDNYIEESDKTYLLDNKDFEQKYILAHESIKIFIYELDKRFDKATVKKIVKETIIKYPGNILLNFVESYLNSKEGAKSNPNVVIIYNKILLLGNESIFYTAKNGIISTHNYKEIPRFVIDENYKLIRKGNEKFNNIDLDYIYNTLTYEQRAFVNELLENDSLVLLEKLFKGYDLKPLLILLKKINVDTNIINNKVESRLSLVNLKMLILLIYASSNQELVSKNINELINAGRYNLITKLINNNLVDSISILDSKTISISEDARIISQLKQLSYVKSLEVA